MGILYPVSGTDEKLCHNILSSTQNFWRAQSPEQWPDETTFSLCAKQLWPKYRAIVEASTSNPGKLNAVSGLKYGLHVGFGKEFLSPKIGGLLVEAANQSLASSTRSLYTSVLKRLTKISRETGVLFSYPMTTLMVQNLVATKISVEIEAPLAKTKVDQKQNLRILGLFFVPCFMFFSNVLLYVS